LTAGSAHVTGTTTRRISLADPIQRELLHQITAAWQHAKQQLEDLKRVVAENTQLAQTQFKTSALVRERDMAYRNLGAAVWDLVKKGKLTLPPALQVAQKACKAAEDRAEAQAREINDLLKEGAEAAERQLQKQPVKTPLANRTKKR